MNRCRKCGITIGKTYKNNKALWCGKCRREVDAELQGIQHEGFDYYFIYHQEMKKGKSQTQT